MVPEILIEESISITTCSHHSTGEWGINKVIEAKWFY
jgi:hypothetical protein